MLRGLFLERAIQYEPEARVFTTSPTTIRALMKQRKRWNTARIELTGRLWRALGYHWTLGFTAACVMLLMARSVLFGLLAYLALPLALVHEYLLTGFLLAYACHVFLAGLLTVFALLLNNELKYWRLLLALPLTPLYGFWFKWLPGTWGWISDVLLFGNVTGFAPEATLIKGGSVRIALSFRIKRFCLLLVRAVLHGDVPFGKFWFGWGETPWTPSGFEGFTSKKRRSILAFQTPGSARLAHAHSRRSLYPSAAVGGHTAASGVRSFRSFIPNDFTACSGRRLGCARPCQPDRDEWRDQAPERDALRDQLRRAARTASGQRPGRSRAALSLSRPHGRPRGSTAFFGRAAQADRPQAARAGRLQRGLCDVAHRAHARAEHLGQSQPG